MKKPLFTTLLMMGVASAAHAQSIADQVISQLEAEGFTYFEVKNGLNQVKIEAVRGAQEVEYVYDLATGELLKQEVGRADSDDQNRSGVRTRNEDRNFVDDDDEGDDDERDDDERDDDERDDDERDDERDDEDDDDEDDEDDEDDDDDDDEEDDDDEDDDED